MNEYLAKLHRLESGAEPLGAEKTVVRQLPKPTKLGSVSFDSDRSRYISGPEPIVRIDGSDSVMRNRNTEGQKSAYVGHCQNRQNLVAGPFPYADALGELEAKCPEYVPTDRWRLCITDAERFLAAWGDKALALGWSDRDLLGLHQPPTNPHPTYSRLSRRECTGLVWGLEGRRVIAMSSNSAAVETSSGALIHRKHNKPLLGPFGDSLDDFIA